MPSPICEVKDGGGAFTSTTDGKDVTPTNTVTIRLASTAGVGAWEISCITTDESSDAATVTASLVIDALAKTATFTAPASGKAYRFQSRINGGVDANGIAQASYTTTFGVYTLTAASRRVHAVDETFESHSTFGWVADLNDLIRNPSAATSPTGTGFTHNTAGAEDAAATANIRYSGGRLQTDQPIDFKNGANIGSLTMAPGGTRTVTIQDATQTLVGRDTTDTLTNKTLTSPVLNTPTLSGATGSLSSPVLTTPQINDTSSDHQYIFSVSELSADRTVNLPLLTSNDAFVFEAHTQTLTNKTLTSPTLGGTITFSSTSMQATGNARARTYSDIANVQTTDATVTSLFTWTILDEAATMVTAEVAGCRSTGAETATYVRKIRFKRDGGTVSAGTVDTSFTSEETSTWDCTIDNSTSTGRVRVTGVAAVTIDWGGVISRLEVSHA
jgi:hypothetical protein